MKFIKSAGAALKRAGVKVIHDPTVDKQGKRLIGLVAVRAFMALGGSAAAIQLLAVVLNAFGISVIPQ